MASAESWAWARQAREAAVQMLYQWEIGRLSVPEVADSFWRIGDTDVELPERVRERASALVAGTDFLSSGARRPLWSSLHDLQVSQHESRRGDAGA